MSITSSSAPTPAWMGGDSIGLGAWQRAQHVGIAAPPASLSIIGGLTSVHDRNTSFIESLSVRIDQGERRSGDDPRVFRSALARAVVVTRRPVPRTMTAPRAISLPDESPEASLSGSADVHLPVDGIEGRQLAVTNASDVPAGAGFRSITGMESAPVAYADLTVRRKAAGHPVGAAATSAPGAITRTRPSDTGPGDIAALDARTEAGPAEAVQRATPESIAGVPGEPHADRDDEARPRSEGSGLATGDVAPSVGVSGVPVQRRPVAHAEPVLRKQATVSLPGGTGTSPGMPGPGLAVGVGVGTGTSSFGSQPRAMRISSAGQVVAPLRPVALAVRTALLKATASGDLAGPASAASVRAEAPAPSLSPSLYHPSSNAAPAFRRISPAPEMPMRVPSAPAALTVLGDESPSTPSTAGAGAEAEAHRQQANDLPAPTRIAAAAADVPHVDVGEASMPLARAADVAGSVAAEPVVSENPAAPSLGQSLRLAAAPLGQGVTLIDAPSGRDMRLARTPAGQGMSLTGHPPSRNVQLTAARIGRSVRSTTAPSPEPGLQEARSGQDAERAGAVQQPSLMLAPTPTPTSTPTSISTTQAASASDISPSQMPLIQPGQQVAAHGLATGTGEPSIARVLRVDQASASSRTDTATGGHVFLRQQEAHPREPLAAQPVEPASAGKVSLALSDPARMARVAAAQRAEWAQPQDAGSPPLMRARESTAEPSVERPLVLMGAGVSRSLQSAIAGGAPQSISRMSGEARAGGGGDGDWPPLVEWVQPSAASARAAGPVDADAAPSVHRMVSMPLARQASPVRAEASAPPIIQVVEPRAVSLRAQDPWEEPTGITAMRETTTVHQSPPDRQGARAEVDIDDLVERAWNALMSRFATEHERRGFARWD